MYYGALIPERLGERIGCDGLQTYNVITYVFYFGEEATVSGLDEKASKRDVADLLTKVYENGCDTLRYYSKGQLVRWHLYRSKGGVIRAKSISR